MHNYLDTPCEFKFAGDTGRFSGMAAVTGNIDSGGDVILPGAFKEMSRTRDGKLLLLYQHRMDQPIGKATAREDSRGLHIDGELLLDDPTARRAYTHMKAGLLDAMSIGYSVLPGGASHKADRRELSAIRVHEASVVTFGMNDQARIETVKSAMACANPRELEAMLRDTLQLSKRKAAAASNALWPILNNANIDANESTIEAEIERALEFNVLSD